MKNYCMFLILSIFVLFLQLSQQATLTDSQKKSNDKKIEELRQLTYESENGLIEFQSPKDFRRYVQRSPRNYDINIFFTGNSCNLCNAMEVEFAKVAQFYDIAGHLYHTEAEDGSIQKPVFFAKIIFGDAWREVFGELEFTSIPNIFVSTEKIYELEGTAKSNLIKQNKWQITHTDGSVTSHKMLEYINQRTGLVNVVYVTPMSEKLSFVFTILFFLSFAAFLFFKCRSLLMNPQLWFLGSFAIYTICCSGIVYNLLHDVPLVRGGEWYTTQQRVQLGLEGYVMSGAIGVAAIILIVWNKAYKIVDDSPVLMRMLYLSLFFGAVLVIWFIERIYKEKGWYSPLFHPPANYVKGSYLRDQGNTI